MRHRKRVKEKILKGLFHHLLLHARNRYYVYFIGGILLGFKGQQDMKEIFFLALIYFPFSLIFMKKLRLDIDVKKSIFSFWPSYMKLYTQYSNVMKINIIDGSGVCKGRKGGGLEGQVNWTIISVDIWHGLTNIPLHLCS